MPGDAQDDPGADPGGDRFPLGPPRPRGAGPWLAGLGQPALVGILGATAALATMAIALLMPDAPDSGVARGDPPPAASTAPAAPAPLARAPEPAIPTMPSQPPSTPIPTAPQGVAPGQDTARLVAPPVEPARPDLDPAPQPSAPSTDSTGTEDPAPRETTVTAPATQNPVAARPDALGPGREPEVTQTLLDPVVGRYRPWTSTPRPDLRERAEEDLGKGNVVGARLWLGEAAAKGDADAVFRLAETYDPERLMEWGVVGLVSDPTKARELYARAFAGGVAAAKERVARLGP